MNPTYCLSSLLQGEKFLCDGCYPAPTPLQPSGVQTISSPVVNTLVLPSSTSAVAMTTPLLPPAQHDKGYNELY